MSHTRHPVAPASSPFRTRRTAILLGLLGLVAVGIVVVALIAGSDANTADPVVSDQPASRTLDRPTEPGTRFDGGPEEGTRGLSAASSSPGTRFDGGPEEGTRGPSTASSSPGTRFDGGPEEGTRGAVGGRAAR